MALVSKQDYVQFKHLNVYEAHKQDVGEAVGRAVAEMVNTEEMSSNRRDYLRGFIAGCTSLLEWEPDFIEDLNKDEGEEENDA